MSKLITPDQIKHNFNILGCAQLYDSSPKNGHIIKLPLVARTPIKKAAGPVFPVITDNDMLPCLQGLEAAPPGSVLYIKNVSEQSEALAGDIFVTAAREQGLAAVIVEGAIRDIDTLQELNFPIFSTEVTFASAKTAKAASTTVPSPISCEGFVMDPEDWIFIDSDGVLVIKQKMVTTVYKAAMILHNREEELRNQLESGKRLSDLCGLNDYLAGRATLRFEA